MYSLMRYSNDLGINSESGRNRRIFYRIFLVKASAGGTVFYLDYKGHNSW